MIKEHMAYVTKEDTRVAGPYRSPGAPNANDAIKGKRNDIYELKNVIDTKSTKDAWEEHFPLMLRHYKGVEAYKLATTAAAARDNHEVVVLFGPPGTGKSALARDILKDAFPHELPFYKSVGKWFDGYSGQLGVILDDYDGLGQCIRDVKNILDKTICRVEVKGGSVALAQELTIITTNTLPSQWFNTTGERARNVSTWDLNAVLRRCHFFLCDTDMYARQAGGGIAPNNVGLRMKTLIHDELQKTRNGQESTYKGVEGELLLRPHYTVQPDNNGNAAIFATPPVHMPDAIVPEAPARTQNAIAALLGMRQRQNAIEVIIDDSDEEPPRPERNVRRRLTVPDEIWGGSPIPEEGSDRNPIIL
jgi:hypothetical protein